MKRPKTLYVCWQDPQGHGIHPVGRLVVNDASPRFQFAYVQGALEAQKDYAFQAFLSFPELHRVYNSDELFPFFLNRRMPQSREDYEEHVRRLGLEAGSVEPLTLLARSGGESATDKIELFAPPEREPVSAAYTYHFFARGIRHIEGAEERISLLKPGDALLLFPEPENPLDKLAVLLLDQDKGKVGYVPHYLVEDLGKFLDDRSEIGVEVDRVNPQPGPVHQRLLCLLRVNPRRNFVPFSTQRYKPIAIAGE